MTKAKVISYPPGTVPAAYREPTIKDPMNKTLHMEIKKAKHRREAREARNERFNPIRGLEKLG